MSATERKDLAVHRHRISPDGRIVKGLMKVAASA
jgi:hypothetical protein